MQYRLSLMLMLSFLVNSSYSQTTETQSADTLETIIFKNKLVNFNYSLDVPGDWIRHDTVMQDGLKVRLYIPGAALKADYPAINMFVADMNGKNINDFTTINIDYLKTNLPGTVILERGNIDSLMYEVQWFTYTKEQNGIVRDMINYIIPLDGFAYMLTCGTTRGTMHKYRSTFDKIARSFKG